MSRSDELRKQFFAESIKLRNLVEKEFKKKEEIDKTLSEIEQVFDSFGELEKSILSRIISVQYLENESEKLEQKIDELKKQTDSLENKKKLLESENERLINMTKTIRSNMNTSIEPSLFLIKYLIDFGFNHLEPLKFEELTLKVFEAFDFKGELTPTSGDEGIDILLTDPKGTKVIVQCKRYSEDQNISPKEVREFLGSMVHANAAYGYFITTTSFSEQAKEFIKDKNIYLIDRVRLKQLFLLAVKAEVDSSAFYEFEKDPRKLISTKLSL
jgi:restriction endonuclease Mrr